MHKYSVGHLCDTAGRALDVYLASEVDAIIAELEGHNAEHQSLAGMQEIRIRQLEQLLREAYVFLEDRPNLEGRIQNALGL